MLGNEISGNCYIVKYANNSVVVFKNLAKKLIGEKHYDIFHLDYRKWKVYTRTDWPKTKTQLMEINAILKQTFLGILKPFHWKLHIPVDSVKRSA